VFQSAPRCGHRGDVGRAGFEQRGDVSIRAPVRTPGRRKLIEEMLAGLGFQSAPRCGHRGDFPKSQCGSCGASFNPRPGADTGATHRRLG